MPVLFVLTLWFHFCASISIKLIDFLRDWKFIPFLIPNTGSHVVMSSLYKTLLFIYIRRYRYFVYSIGPFSEVKELPHSSWSCNFSRVGNFTVAIKQKIINKVQNWLWRLSTAPCRIEHSSKSVLLARNYTMPKHVSVEIER